MPVIGTAGHVDHGKSTLIRAITGRDPDRWEEEKARGLTIDLGFAWTELPGGVEVSFVDVPGHERFIKNMLAGIEAIDVALLVVAADEGWMPQSEEHLAVLDLLGVQRGVVALTKTDRVDDDLVELATLETEERLQGTGLEGAPVIPVSGTTGAGLDRLLAALERAVGAGSVPEVGRPRMWIDRAFTIPGAGTVVTGTLLGGALAVGDQVAVWPGPQPARVRSLQTHERGAERVEPGRRVAVNLAGLDRSELARGAMLGRPGDWSPATRIAADVRPARYVEELSNRGAYHLHLGSGAWPVQLRMVRSDLAYLDLPEALCVEIGDRFILRETGRRLVVGGGRVLAPDPPRPSRFSEEAEKRLRTALDATPQERAEALLALRGRERPGVLAALSGGGRPEAALPAGDELFDPSEAEAVSERIHQAVSEYHRTHPLRPGMLLAEIAERLDLTTEAVVSLAERSPELVVEGSVIRRGDFSVGRTEAQERAWQEARRMLTEAGTRAVPRVAELGLPEELVHALVREGELVRVSPDLVYLPEQVEELVGVMRSFAEPFTVSEFKDRAGVSRKYAVPLLEWADREGVTVRMGDRRRLRNGT